MKARNAWHQAVLEPRMHHLSDRRRLAKGGRIWMFRRVNGQAVPLRRRGRR